MKLCLFVLAALAVGLAECSSGWKAGYEYVYKVKSRTIVGLEGKEQQYSGFQMRIPALRIQVRDPNTLVVKAESSGLQKIHDSLDEGWLAEDPDTKQIQDAETRDIEEPFVLRMDRGTVKSIQVSGRISPEAANIQKAIASAIQLDMAEANSIEKAAVHSNILTGLGSKKERVIFRTRENEISGECEQLYDISVIPPYMVKENPSLVPVPEACPGNRFLEVTATTNYTNCKQRPAVNFASPAQIKGTPGTQRIGDFWNRAAETNYILCGKGRQDYVIQKIASKEVLAIAPLGYETAEDLTVGASLNLTLKDVRQIASPISGPASPVKLEDLTFEYPEPEVDAEQGGNRMGSPSPFEGSARYVRSTRRQQNQDDDDDDDDDENDADQSQSQGGKWRRSHKNSGKGGANDNDDDDDDSQEQSGKSRHGKQGGKQHSRWSQSQKGRRGGNNQDSDEDNDSDDDSDESGSSESWNSRRQRAFHPRSLSLRDTNFGQGNNAHHGGSGSGSNGQPDLKSSPKFPLLQFGVTGSSSKFPGSSQIKNAAVKLAQDIANDLEDPNQLAQEKTAAKVHILSSALAMLDLDQLHSVAQQVAQQDPAQAQGSSSSKSSSSNQQQSDEQTRKQTAKQILLDAILMSGSNPAIVFVAEKIEKQELKGEAAAQQIMAIPKYAKTPTKQLINRVKQLVKKVSENGKPVDQPETTALLAWSQLIRQACMDPQGRRSRYPRAQFGKFCSPRSSEIEQNWVPYLAERLHKAQSDYEEAVLITALGNIGHESILPALRKYINGEKSDASNHNRVKAIFALKNIVLPNSYYSQQQQSVKKAAQNALITIFSNSGEQYEVRMAAFALLVYSDAPFHVWQKAALRTWLEPDNQVASFVYSTMQNMADMDDPKHYDLSQKAYQALKLAKPVQQGLPFSQNQFHSTTVDDWNFSYLTQLSWFGGRSFAPGNVYLRATSQKGGLSQSALEASVNASAIYQLISDAIQGEDEPESRFPELAKLTKTLNIKKQEDGPAEASAFLQIKEMQRMFPLDESLAPALEKLAKAVQQGPSKAEGSQKINYQKAAMLDDIIVSVPLVTGVPAVWTLKTPLLVSVRGHVKAQASEDQINVQASLQPVLTKRTEAAASVVEPFSMRRFTAGIMKHYQFYAPLKASASLDAGSQQAQLTIRPGGDDDSDQIQAFHFHVVPFTSEKKLGDFKPITESGDVKKIHYQDKPAKLETTVGNKALGLKFQVTAKTENEQAKHNGFAAIWQRLQKHSLMSALQSWADSPNASPRELTVQWNQKDSQTEEIKVKVQISTATKKGGRDQVETTPRSLLKDIMSPEGASDSSRKQKMIRSLESVTKGSAVTIDAKLELQQAGGQKAQAYKTSLTILKGTNGEKEEAKVHIQRQPIPGYDDQPWELCADAHAKFPEMPTYSYADTINQPIEASAQAQIAYGQQCSQPQIKIQVQMQRSEGQKQYVKNSQQGKECEQDNKEGREFSPSCRNATIEASKINQYEATIEFQSVGSKVQNASYHAEDLLTAALYPYMSKDRIGVQNPPNQIKIRAKVNPSDDEDDYLNVKIEKPSANIEFTGIPLSQEQQIFFPLNAKQSLSSRIYDYAQDGNDQNECTLEGDELTTFDNQTLNIELNENYHLLVKDRTQQAKVAVLAKSEGQGKDEKKVKIIVRHHVITLSGKGQGRGQAPIVNIDGQEVDIPSKGQKEIEDKHGNILIKIVKNKDGFIRVEAPEEGIEVTTDGELINIEASQILSNNLAGLCGDYNGEQSADLKTPEMCVESPEDPEDFVRSYEVSDSAQQHRRQQQDSDEDDDDDDDSDEDDSDENGKGSGSGSGSGGRGGQGGKGGRSGSHQQKRKGGRKSAVRGCVKERDVVTAQVGDALSGAAGSSSSSSRMYSFRMSGKHQQDQHSGRSQQQGKRQGGSGNDSDSDEDDSDENNNNGSGSSGKGGNGGNSSMRYRHKVIKPTASKTCFSSKQVPECKSGHTAKHTITKEVDFVCFDKSSQKADRLEDQARQGQNIQPELRSKSADTTQRLYIPTSCQ